MNVTLPYKNVSEFPAMLKEVEANMNGLGIASIGITNASLEEVFLK